MKLSKGLLTQVGLDSVTDERGNLGIVELTENNYFEIKRFYDQILKFGFRT